MWGCIRWLKDEVYYDYDMRYKSGSMLYPTCLNRVLYWLWLNVNVAEIVKWLYISDFLYEIFIHVFRTSSTYKCTLIFSCGICRKCTLFKLLYMIVQQDCVCFDQLFIWWRCCANLFIFKCWNRVRVPQEGLCGPLSIAIIVYPC